MKTRTMTQEEIRQSGLEALLAKLGSTGMIRFLQQFEVGSGDYTRDRRRLLGDVDIESLLPRAKKRAKRRQA